jgi:formylglycine-generating enzyme required for sulfatase activity
MTSIDPVDGAVVAPGPMMVKGMASEEVARVTIQGKEATVTGSGFATEVEVPEGSVVLEIELEDKAGNVSTASVEYRAMSVPEGLALLEVDPTYGPVFQSVTAPRVELVRIEGGTFSMGSNDGDADEKPVHEVTFSPYLMARTETTNAAFAEFVEATGARKPRNPQWSPDYFDSSPEYPVVNVSWQEAKAFCEWAGLRLPTEAEWEFAAVGDTGGTYPWGNEAPGAGGTWRAVHDAKDDGFAQDAPVGSLEAGISPFGMRDMSGNVWEWTADGYRPYSADAQTDPEPASGSEKVLRGGSWTSSADAIRAANRYKLPANTRRHNIGFRCAAGPLEQPATPETAG